MTDVDNNDQEFMVVDQIQDSIVSHTVGVTTLELPFEWFTLGRIALKIIKGLNETSV